MLLAAATLVFGGVRFFSQPEKIAMDSNNSAQHGGEMFSKDDVTLEVVFAEESAGARILIYPRKNGKVLAPTEGNLSLVLKRPNATPQEVKFSIENNHYLSLSLIPEPHAFDADIVANIQGNNGELKKVDFSFSKEEGKIELTDEQINASSIVLQKSAAAKINNILKLPGEIRFNEDRTAHVVPRAAGVVEAVQANLGQQVKKGQVLAIIASSAVSDQRSEWLSAQQRLSLAQNTFTREKKLWEEKISAQQDFFQAEKALREAEIMARNAQQKLQALGVSGGKGSSSGSNRYEIRAPFDGMVVEKHISLGEAVKEDANIFTISDLSTVWAEIIVPPQDINTIRMGALATIKATAFDATANGKVSYIGALLGEQTRTAKARITLANPENAWRPGMFVNVEVVSSAVQVPVSVTADAIHSVDNQNVVYVRIPDGFLAQPVEIGRADGEYVEIIEGLKAGSSYAAAGSFVIKAEQGKGSTEHAH